jgi:hypothetical protein
MSDRLSTGVDVIDRHMHGGVPVGSLLALSAPPETQSDRLLAAAAGSADTHYLTTDRTADAVEARLGQSPGVEADLHVASVSPETVAADPAASLDAPSGGFVVVDSFDAFERLGRDDQLRTLRALSERLRERESVGILACSRQDDRTAARRRTLRFADVVWVLHLTVTTLSVETRLTITKVRDGRPHLEPVKLKLTDRVVVDTSRDIA